MTPLWPPEVVKGAPFRLTTAVTQDKRHVMGCLYLLPESHLGHTFSRWRWAQPKGPSEADSKPSAVDFTTSAVAN